MLKCLKQGFHKMLPAASSSEVLQLSFEELNAHFSLVNVFPPAVIEVIMHQPEKYSMGYT